MKDTIIFGVKQDNKIHYIGKTNLYCKEDKLIKSKLRYLYNNPKLNELIKDNVEIINLCQSTDEKWYSDKLKEVVNKYNENHPLKNAQWMLEGKRGIWSDTNGYWFNKKRDDNTIAKLAESKFKKVIQFNENGELVKIWDSAKQIGIEVFNDYGVKYNGKGMSRIYKILKNSKIENKFAKGHYWFKYDEIMKNYKEIPEHLDIDKIKTSQREKRSEIRKKSPQYAYTVIEVDENNKMVRNFNNPKEASKFYNINISTIHRRCRFKNRNSKPFLKYGKKKII